MHGFSERVHHAFAFTAKHHAAAAPAGAGADYFSHPANVAVILARYSVDQATLIAGILHHAGGSGHGGENPDFRNRKTAP